MSLLATYASEYDNSNSENKINENNNNLHKKKNTKNKTLKKRPVKDNAKMEAMLSAINDEDEDDLNNFEPLAPPAISKIQQYNDYQKETPVEKNVIENFNDLPSEYAKQYYQQYVPYVNQESVKNSETTQSNELGKMAKPSTNSDLQTKLDYLIYLLENQSNEKTDCVMEELILYSFLGIFTIFIVDSFAKVGKYIR